MTKKIYIKNPEKCHGCELCVFEQQRQLKRVGLSDALIRIFRQKSELSEYTRFGIEMDPRINSLDIDKICKICPREVFDIKEEDNGNKS